jgi:ribonuclease T2
MLVRSRNTLIVVSLLILFTACSRPAHETNSSATPASNDSSSSPSSGSSSSGSDYYLLALSWAPQFCATHAGNASSSECDPGRHFGFVVHGLWPQNDDGSYPQNCAPARPVAEQTVRRMLAIMPARGLIQHESAEHGTCSGLSPQEYFAAIEKAFNAVQIPPEYRAPAQTISASPSEIEQKFAAANHAPAGAFRVSCSHAELVELNVCLAKDLRYRECGSNVRECRVRQVTVRPVP